jgi:hypothetical protein
LIHVLLHSFTYSGIHHDFHVTGCLCCLKVAEHLRTPWFSWSYFAQSSAVWTDL